MGGCIVYFSDGLPIVIQTDSGADATEVPVPLQDRTVTLIFTIKSSGTIEFFTNSLQYENANIANFDLALPIKIRKSNKMCNIKI